MREIYEKINKFVSDDSKLSDMVRKGKQNFGGSAAVFHSSTLYFLIGTAMPNFSAVTPFLVEFPSNSVLVFKSVTPALHCCNNWASS